MDSNEVLEKFKNIVQSEISIEEQKTKIRAIINSLDKNLKFDTCKKICQTSYEELYGLEEELEEIYDEEDKSVYPEDIYVYLLEDEKENFCEYLNIVLDKIDEIEEFENWINFFEKYLLPEVKEDVVFENFRKILELLDTKINLLADEIRNGDDKYKKINLTLDINFAEEKCINFMNSLYAKLKEEKRKELRSDYYNWILESIYDEEFKDELICEKLVDHMKGFLEKLSEEEYQQELEGLINWGVDNENISLKTYYITNCMKAFDGTVRIQVLPKVLEHINKYCKSIENKKMAIEDVLQTIDKETIIDNFEMYVEQIDSIDVDIDKTRIYYAILNYDFSSKGQEYYEKCVELIRSKLQKDKKYEKMDLSSNESCLNSLIFEDILKSGINKWDQKSQEEKEKIEKYLLSILKGNTIDVIENDALIAIFDEVRRGKIQVSEELKNALEEMAMALPELVDLSKYDGIINGSEQIIDEEKRKEFIKNLEIYRIKIGKLPKNIYNYIIKENVIGNIENSNRIVKEAIIDMGFDYLDELEIQDYNLAFAILDEGTLGEHVNNKITLSTVQLERYNSISVINTLFHEIRHAYQFQQQKQENVYDTKIYRMIKEEVIRENLFDFYRDNYFDMEIEFDARMHSNLKTYEYLVGIGVPTETIAEREDENLANELGKNLEQEIYNNIQHDRTMKKYTRLFEKGKLVNVDEIFEYVISGEDSEAIYVSMLEQEYFKSILQKYPMLNYEYKISEAGMMIRKTNEELEADLEEKLKTTEDEKERGKIIKFYKSLLKEKQQVKGENKYISFLEENEYEISQPIRKRLEKSWGNNGNESVLEFAKQCYINSNPQELRNAMLEIKRSMQQNKGKDKNDDLEK